MGMMINRRRVYGGGEKLPYDAEIEYLESNGTQWIDTGIPFTDDITFVIDKIRLQNTVNAAFLGYRFVDAAVAVGNMRYFFAYDDGRIGARLGVNVNNSIAISKNTFHKIYFGGNRLYIDEQTMIYIPKRYATTNFGNIYIFACNTGYYYSADVSKFYGAIGSTRIMRNGEIVRDFIPVRVGQVGYMYDKVSGKLFGNAGTGDFILGPDKQPLFVDMGLPSGTLWATRNIDVTQPDGFAASPFQYECSFFSWGNVDGHNPISAYAFDYNWGNSNAQEPWYEGQPYGETQGSTLTGNIPVNDTYDAARANLGAPWRIPKRETFRELFNNVIYINEDGAEIPSTTTNKIVTVNGVNGVYIQSKINGQRLFLACSGTGVKQNWNYHAYSMSYWSSIRHSSHYAFNLYIFSGGVRPYKNYTDRCIGVPIRPVI